MIKTIKQRISKLTLKWAKKILLNSLDEDSVSALFYKILRYDKLDNLDLQWAKKYVIKSELAKQSGVDFNLSFTSFKNLMRANRCAYSGIKLTTPSGSAKYTDRTIDRIDNTKGYEKGNVAAVCNGINALKSKVENPTCDFSQKDYEEKLAKIKAQPWRYIKHYKKNF